MNENQIALFNEHALAIMQELSELKKKQDELAELEKNAKAQLQEQMEKYGIISFKNEYVTISLVKGSTTTSIDLKALEEKEPELYNDLLNDYPKTTTKKDSVRIIVK